MSLFDERSKVVRLGKVERVAGIECENWFPVMVIVKSFVVWKTRQVACEVCIYYVLFNKIGKIVNAGRN